MQLGVLSLIPIIVLFVMIFTTKRMLLSLTCASLVGAVLLGGFDFAGVWLGKVQEAFMAGTMGYLFLLLALFGILINLLDRSGAAVEFANWMSKFANTRRKALILTYILGWLLFVDDYLHNMALGTAMKKICDKHKIPRTLLGVMVNGSAATVCVLIPISTWGVFYSGYFEELGVANAGQGLSTYISAIPMMFYPIIMLVILLLLAFGVFPLIGQTKRDNKLAQETGIVLSKEFSNEGVDITADDADGEAEAKGSPIWFILPMAAIIALTIITGDCMIGCMGAILVTGIIILARKTQTIIELLDAGFQGVASMVSVCCVIAVALTMVEINKATGMTEFVVNVMTPLLKGSAFAFPAIVFAFMGVYVFFVGGAWDMSMVFMPIFIPVAMNIGVNPVLASAAMVSVAAASSGIYVASDATMLTSASCEMQPQYQMRSMLPYALIAYALTIVAYLIAGIAL